MLQTPVIIGEEVTSLVAIFSEEAVNELFLFNRLIVFFNLVCSLTSQSQLQASANEGEKLVFDHLI